MTHIKLIRSYPDMTAALEAVDDLYAAFTKANRHKTAVELMVSSVSRPAPKGVKRFAAPEPVDVRAHYAKEHEAEAAWFVAEANK